MADIYETLPLEDMRYCVSLGDNCYLFIEGIYAEAEDVELFDYGDKYAVYSTYVDLNALNEEQLNDAVLTYYPSLSDMKSDYFNLDSESFNKILAGMILENDLGKCEFHGYFAKQEAMEYMADWLEDREIEEPELD